MTFAHDHQLSQRLDREWEHLCCRRAVLDRVRSWHTTRAPFRSLDEFLGLTGFRATGLAPDEIAAADALLGRLVVLAAVEPIAGRIAFQRILPGLLAIVRAEQGRSQRVDAFDLLAAEAWMAICRPRTTTPTGGVAAKLLHEARHNAFVRPRRLRRVAEVPHREVEAVIAPSEPTHSSTFDELVAVLTEARDRGFADDQMKIVRGLLEHGRVNRLAAAAAVSTRTVRNRRDRAVADIRRRVLAA